MRGAETSEALAFAELLRRYRASARMTQEDLASRTGLTPQAIGLLERGERRRPHAYTVQVLGEALGLEGREFAEFEAAARRPPAHRRDRRDFPSRSSSAAYPANRARAGGGNPNRTPAPRGRAAADAYRSWRRRQDTVGAGGSRAFVRGVRGWCRLRAPCAVAGPGSRPLGPRPDARNQGRGRPVAAGSPEAASGRANRCSCCSTTSSTCSRPFRVVAELVRGVSGSDGARDEPGAAPAQRRAAVSSVSAVPVAGASLESSPAVRLFEERAMEVSPGFEVRARERGRGG